MLCSCEVKVKTGPSAGDDVSSGDNSSKIKNDITVKSNGLKVEQAFLLFEDGKRVPADNTVDVNQKVILRLIISGWTEKDGKVFLSGGETIETSEGDQVLDQRNLFDRYKEGLSAEDAKYISMNVVITRVDKLYDYYKVSFFLKDESEPANFIEGYYKLHIR